MQLLWERCGRTVRGHALLWSGGKSTHSCRQISQTSVVWTLDTFKDNYGIKRNFTKYLKESCGLGYGQHFLIKYFLQKSTHSCRQISQTSVVWTLDTFKDSYEIKRKFTKYLKGSCGLGCGQHFLFKYFLKNA